MTAHSAFELIEDRDLPELASTARYYRHKRTGAELLSIINEDENKVFGITFKTLPADSTGVAHILEHSVLCGSKNYPARKPFVEMLKGSLQTFLNAMTFPDKTAYPVASQNLQDFYNLVGVYLDAVLYPNLSRETFLQEGWHFDLETADAPLDYKGVVFNEMKGAYSSPDTVMHVEMLKSVLPDTIYANASGGDPRVMPELTYETFRDFHTRYYTPSNARVVFAGDDDPDERLAILDRYFSGFEKTVPAPDVALQRRFAAPRHVEASYAASPEQGTARDGRMVVTWLLDEPKSERDAIALGVLGYLLTGTSAAPLKKALTDSGLGESVIGGLSQSTRQPLASFGLKGIDPDRGGEVEALILSELKRLADEGIDRKAIEAAVNTLEFQMRELNTGSFPRGIALMFGVMGRWLHGADPLEALAFEAPLQQLKAEIEANPRLFETMIRDMLVNNMHRVSLSLRADSDQARREADAERERLDTVRAGMDEAAIENAVIETQKLRALQEAPEAPEALASLPRLRRADLPRQNTEIPTEETELSGIPVLVHDLPTNGIVYLDVGFNLRNLTAELLPYIPIFSRALLQTGTRAEDFVSLTQRIGRSTGGIHTQRVAAPVYGSDRAAAWLLLRGKAVPEHAGEMLAIMGDVLLDARLDNPDRIRQMVREAKAGSESRLVPGGHQLAATRLEAGFGEAGWINEQLGGISNLFFLRDLERKIENDWPSVLQKLEAIRDILLVRSGMIANVTSEAAHWTDFSPQLGSFIDGLPRGDAADEIWPGPNLPPAEGLTFPAQVNYVAQGVNLEKAGYPRNGAAAVAVQHLNTTYLWDKIRVQGGAYGGFAGYNGPAGVFRLGSYRDPNLTRTLDVYAGVPAALRQPIEADDLEKTVIGVIGSIDRYMLPDAKGFSALTRHLTGETAQRRQLVREQVLNTTPADFVRLADALELAMSDAHTIVLGSDEAIGKANGERGGFLSVTKVM
jgi:hypothetical protein